MNKQMFEQKSDSKNACAEMQVQNKHDFEK